MRFLFAVVFIVVVVNATQSDIDDWLKTAKDATESKGEIWALLVAGSSTWYNYRHQSDVCHLYKLLTKQQGIPPQNIIVMMYNDIAYNENNETPGIIINALHGTDVYEGTMIDYMGHDVTPENFLKILKGERMPVGSRKTLRSGPDDYVFVNFVDHGDTGVLGFPHSELHLVDLNKALHEMHENNQYKQMLWYVEACFSGSMFEKLSPDIRMTAHTAANTEESSYACVWDHYYGVYLGDCWSLNWMNNTEQIFPRLYLETVEQQYEIVKKMTTTSHPSIYGDLKTIYHEKISTFMGHSEKVEVETHNTIMIQPTDAIAAQDVMLESLRRRQAYNQDHDLDKEIRYHEETEQQVQILLEGIVVAVSGSKDMLAVFQESRQSISHPQCNKEVLDTFYNKCFKIQTHPYITKYTFWISNLCNTYSTERIVETVHNSCNDITK